MGIATKTRMTEAEFMRMPDDGRKYELVNGEPKEVPTSFLHGVLVCNLIFSMYDQAQKLGYLGYGLAGYRMANDNIRCPDFSFTRKERFRDRGLPQGFGDFAPDLCGEFITSLDEPEGMAQKVREYFGAGAEQIWHLFPDTKTVRVYLSPEMSVEYHEDDEITGGDILPTFSYKVAELFKLRS